MVPSPIWEIVLGHSSLCTGCLSHNPAESAVWHRSILASHIIFKTQKGSTGKFGSICEMLSTNRLVAYNHSLCYVFIIITCVSANILTSVPDSVPQTSLCPHTHLSVCLWGCSNTTVHSDCRWEEWLHDIRAIAGPRRKKCPAAYFSAKLDPVSAGLPVSVLLLLLKRLY